MPTNTYDSPVRFVQSMITFAVLGAMWNVAKIKTRNLPRETMVRQVAQALGIGAVAGIIVALQGGEPDPGNFEKVMVIAVPIFDEILDAVRDAKRAYRLADDNDGERTDELAAALVAATDNFTGEGESPRATADADGEGEQDTQRNAGSGAPGGRAGGAPRRRPEERSSGERDNSSGSGQSTVNSGP